MKLNKLLLMIVLILIAELVQAQSPTVNLKKYWYYRNRLKEEFMVVSSGNEMGTNIPASRRIPTERAFFYWGDATAGWGSI